ncbi:arginine--tRNA ligase [Hirschia baltica]|uniref:Arginine--tRNA ligase n=1 Tax=Hirschia baltica (strain ATCC 49814 / DSM 5838 / IFAM 1418) TaxID=582402 RepID=C6XRB0_HIRBI|nr:arginine--tRNA ligase [Hirschia baltica]ACT58742.1 arginyl-tRNA synthetase [Hirschia baltica ATCC 49814]
MTDIANILSGAVGDIFEGLGLDRKLGQVRRADRPDLADFQCNGAMAAAKAAKRNPREIAGEVAPKIEALELVESVDVAGPGFLNITVSAAALEGRTTEILADGKAGGGSVETPRNVMIDFGGWNVAKPMHIGHLRSTIIGDSLQRLFRFLGDDVTSDVHLGDWGLQMGLLIVGVSEEQPDLPYFDDNFEGEYPEESPVSMDDLERLYPLYAGKMKAENTVETIEDGKTVYKKVPNPEYREDVRALAQTATAELQAGRRGYRALWKQFCAVTQIGLERECGDLGVQFDLWKGESDANVLLPEIVEDLKSRKVAVESDGAWVIYVERESDKKDMPPFMLLNSQGAVGYHATDMGTILDRKRTNKPDLTLYVVDARQALHFEQVFRAAEIAGYEKEASLEHIGFGTMNGKDGKPFKTREGGVLKLHDFIQQAKDKARERLEETGMGADFSAEERADIADKVALAAIKFADLSNVRTKNYVFDLDQFVAFEGKTGPYLLYAAVRVKSLMRRAKEEGIVAGAMKIELKEERVLALQLDAFEGALKLAYANRTPHGICDHVYNLAQAFSSFWTNAPILKAGVPDDVKASRLALAQATLKQLETGLSLIGIETPERM